MRMLRKTAKYADSLEVSKRPAETLHQLTSDKENLNEKQNESRLQIQYYDQCKTLGICYFILMIIISFAIIALISSGNTHVLGIEFATVIFC